MTQAVLHFKTDEPVISVAADQKTLMHSLKLSPQEARLLKGMLDYSWVGGDSVNISDRTIRQIAFTLRRKLEQRGIWILNNGAGQYSLPPTSKIALKRALDQTSHGVQP